MGHKYAKEDLLAAALEVASQEGLSTLTFGLLARRMGVPDRILVYYFPTKERLIAEILQRLGERLQAALQDAFSTPAADHRALARRAWPVLTQPEFDATFRLFLEANGLACAGLEPYRSVAPALAEAWIAWLVPLFADSGHAARTEAEAALALIDGLLLLRHIVGPEAAERAAACLGVSGAAPT